MRSSLPLLLSASLLLFVHAQESDQNTTSTSTSTSLTTTSHSTTSQSPDFTLLSPTPNATLAATDPITLRWAYAADADTNLRTNPLTIEIGYTTSGTLEAHVTVNAAASLSSTTLPAGIITSVAPGETAAVGVVLSYHDESEDGGEEVGLARVDGLSLVGGGEEAGADEGGSKLSTEAKIGIGVGFGMGMSAAIFGIGFWCRRRRKRKGKGKGRGRDAAAAVADTASEGDEEGSGDGKMEGMDPAEMDAVERGNGKAELGVESQKVELDADGQKLELDAASQMTLVRLAELEEKPARYELAG